MSVSIIIYKILNIFSRTYQKLYEICCQSFIGNHLEYLVHESKTIIKKEQRQDMMNMYLVLSKIKDGTNSLVDIFKEHVQQCGLRVIESLEQKQVNIQ